MAIRNPMAPSTENHQPVAVAPVLEPSPGEFPTYTCHRKVQAIKIKSVVGRPSPAGPAILIVPDDPAHDSFEVSLAYINRCRPCPGMYYVKHADGYESASPASVFEADHTKI